jgi:hypothetical protein
MSCCPPGSSGFLSSDGNHVGVKLQHGSTDLYITGPATSASGVVLVPDIWGWDSGRTRNIADALASNGWIVVRVQLPPLPPHTLLSLSFVPSLFVLGGAKALDSCFPRRRRDRRRRYGAQPETWRRFPRVLRVACRIPSRGSQRQAAAIIVLSCVTSLAQVLRPKMSDAFAALHARGVAKVAMVGHCWGVWACAHVAADAELSQTLVCVCGPHPSIGLETIVFKRSVEDLASRILRPFLLMPCQVLLQLYILSMPSDL